MNKLQSASHYYDSNPAQKLILAALLLMPFAPYRVQMGGFNWNLDRILVVFAAAVVLLNFLQGAKLPKAPLWLLLALVASVCIAFLSPTMDYGLAKPYAASSTYCYLVFFLSMLIAATGERGQTQLCAVLGIAALIFLVFSAYSVHRLYMIQQPIDSLPLQTSIPLPLAPVSEHLTGINQPRIALPFPTPQALSTAAGALSLLFLFWPPLRPRWLWITLGALMFVVSLATISRTGLYSIVAALVAVFFLAGEPGDRRWIAGRSLAILIIASVTAVFGFLFLESDTLEVFGRLSRSLDQTLAGPHYSIRLHALEIWSRADWLERIAGVGIGNFQRESPALRAHMSVLTLLVERGILGAILAYGVIALTPIVFFWSSRRSTGANRKRYLAGLVVSTQLLFASVFYETYEIPFLWIILGLLIGIAIDDDLDSRVNST